MTQALCMWQADPVYGQKACNAHHDLAFETTLTATCLSNSASELASSQFLAPNRRAKVVTLQIICIYKMETANTSALRAAQ